jgi:hypothetical protein
VTINLRRFLLLPGLTTVLVAAPLLLAACGSSSGGGGGASPTPTLNAQQQVKADWQKFFSGTAKQRVALLQNGRQYATQLRALSANPLATQLKAKVISVQVQSPTRASVRYTILLAGQPVLKNQTGTAVKQGGTWKVGTQSFQQLLQLQQGSLPSSGSPMPGATSSP